RWQASAPSSAPAPRRKTAAAKTSTRIRKTRTSGRSVLEALVLDVLADDGFGELGDDLPDDLLDDLARHLRERFVFGALRGHRGQLLLDRRRDAGVRDRRAERRVLGCRRGRRRGRARSRGWWGAPR